MFSIESHGLGRMHGCEMGDHRSSLGRGEGMRHLALLCYRLIPRDVGWAKAAPCPSRAVIAVMAEGFHLSRYLSPHMDDSGPVYLYEMGGMEGRCLDGYGIFLY